MMISGIRQQLLTPRILQAILQKESFASLYVGCLPAVLSTATSGAIFYGVYDILKERHLRCALHCYGSHFIKDWLP